MSWILLGGRRGGKVRSGRWWGHSWSDAACIPCKRCRCSRLFRQPKHDTSWCSLIRTSGFKRHAPRLLAGHRLFYISAKILSTGGQTVMVAWLPLPGRQLMRSHFLQSPGQVAPISCRRWADHSMISTCPAPVGSLPMTIRDELGVMHGDGVLTLSACLSTKTLRVKQLSFATLTSSEWREDLSSCDSPIIPYMDPMGHKLL